VALAADYYACIIAYIIVAASLHDVVRSLFVGQPASKSQAATTTSHKPQPRARLAR
jgi:hypothetical protein